MRDASPAIIAYRSARRPVFAHALVWVTARVRGTNDTASLGLWTGEDHQEFVIGAQTRTYFGAGNVLQVPDFEAAVGLEVRTYEIGLATTSPEVDQLIRGYDVRQAPIQVHRAEYNENGGLIAPPERIFKGWVDGAPFPTPAIGGEASVMLRVVSNSRMLTRYVANTKSDPVQKRRSGDRFRRYGSVAGETEVVWGGEKYKEPVKALPPQSLPAPGASS